MLIHISYCVLVRHTLCVEASTVLQHASWKASGMYILILSCKSGAFHLNTKHKIQLYDPYQLYYT